MSIAHNPWYATLHCLSGVRPHVECSRTRIDIESFTVADVLWGHNWCICLHATKCDTHTCEWCMAGTHKYKTATKYRRWSGCDGRKLGMLISTAQAIMKCITSHRPCVLCGWPIYVGSKRERENTWNARISCCLACEWQVSAPPAIPQDESACGSFDRIHRCNGTWTLYMNGDGRCVWWYSDGNLFDPMSIVCLP